MRPRAYSPAEELVTGCPDHGVRYTSTELRHPLKSVEDNADHHVATGGWRMATETTVLLRKRVITASCAFDAERKVAMPIQPFIGLELYNTEREPPGCDGSEDKIESIACDLKSGQVICYLPLADFRSKNNGGDVWSEEEVRARFRDWTITLDRPGVVPLTRKN